MKSFFLKALSVFLTVVVLLTSTGFGLIEHSCSIRGKKTTLIHKKQSCCVIKHSKSKGNSGQKELTFNKKACCNDEEKYENIEYSSSISQLVAKFIKTFADTVYSTAIYLFKLLVKSFLSATSALFDTSAHLLSGRDIIVMLQKFLI
jgi:hypothetical protein